MPISCVTVVEDNRSKISTTITELLAFREDMPDDKRLVLDRVIKRLNDALAGDDEYLRGVAGQAVHPERAVAASI